MEPGNKLSDDKPKFLHAAAQNQFEEISSKEKTDSDPDNLDAYAIAELGSILKSEETEIRNEAARLEESRRPVNCKPQITAAIIREAYENRKYKSGNSKKKKPSLALQICSVISSLVTGALLTKDSFKDWSGIILFIVSLAVMIVSHCVSFINGRSND